MWGVQRGYTTESYLDNVSSRGAMPTQMMGAELYVLGGDGKYHSGSCLQPTSPQTQNGLQRQEHSIPIKDATTISPSADYMWNRHNVDIVMPLYKKCSKWDNVPTNPNAAPWLDIHLSWQAHNTPSLKSIETYSSLGSTELFDPWQDSLDQPRVQLTTDGSISCGTSSVKPLYQVSSNNVDPHQYPGTKPPQVNPNDISNQLYYNAKSNQCNKQCIADFYQGNTKLPKNKTNQSQRKQNHCQNMAFSYNSTPTQNISNRDRSIPNYFKNESSPSNLIPLQGASNKNQSMPTHCQNESFPRNSTPVQNTSKQDQYIPRHCQNESFPNNPLSLQNPSNQDQSISNYCHNVLFPSNSTISQTASNRDQNMPSHCQNESSPSNSKPLQNVSNRDQSIPSHCQNESFPRNSLPLQNASNRDQSMSNYCPKELYPSNSTPLQNASNRDQSMPSHYQNESSPNNSTPLQNASNRDQSMPRHYQNESFPRNSFPLQNISNRHQSMPSHSQNELFPSNLTTMQNISNRDQNIPSHCQNESFPSNSTLVQNTSNQDQSMPSHFKNELFPSNALPLPNISNQDHSMPSHCQNESSPINSMPLQNVSNRDQSMPSQCQNELPPCNTTALQNTSIQDQTLSQLYQNEPSPCNASFIQDSPTQDQSMTKNCRNENLSHNSTALRNTACQGSRNSNRISQIAREVTHESTPDKLSVDALGLMLEKLALLEEKLSTLEDQTQQINICVCDGMFDRPGSELQGNTQSASSLQSKTKPLIPCVSQSIKQKEGSDKTRDEKLEKLSNIAEDKKLSDYVLSRHSNMIDTDKSPEVTPFPSDENCFAVESKITKLGEHGDHSNEREAKSQLRISLNDKSGRFNSSDRQGKRGLNSTHSGLMQSMDGEYKKTQLQCKSLPIGDTFEEQLPFDTRRCSRKKTSQNSDSVKSKPCRENRIAAKGTIECKPTPVTVSNTTWIIPTHDGLPTPQTTQLTTIETKDVGLDPILSFQTFGVDSSCTPSVRFCTSDHVYPSSLNREAISSTDLLSSASQLLRVRNEGIITTSNSLDSDNIGQPTNLDSDLELLKYCERKVCQSAKGNRRQSSRSTIVNRYLDPKHFDYPYSNRKERLPPAGSRCATVQIGNVDLDSIESFCSQNQSKLLVGNHSKYSKSTSGNQDPMPLSTDRKYSRNRSRTQPLTISQYDEYVNAVLKGGATLNEIPNGKMEHSKGSQCSFKKNQLLKSILRSCANIANIEGNLSETSKQKMEPKTVSPEKTGTRVDTCITENETDNIKKTVRNNFPLPHKKMYSECSNNIEQKERKDVKKHKNNLIFKETEGEAKTPLRMTYTSLATVNRQNGQDEVEEISENWKINCGGEEENNIPKHQLIQLGNELCGKVIRFIMSSVESDSGGDSLSIHSQKTDESESGYTSSGTAIESDVEQKCKLWMKAAQILIKQEMAKANQDSTMFTPDDKKRLLAGNENNAKAEDRCTRGSQYFTSEERIQPRGVYQKMGNKNVCRRGRPVLEERHTPNEIRSDNNIHNKLPKNKLFKSHIREGSTSDISFSLLGGIEVAQLKNKNKQDGSQNAELRTPFPLMKEQQVSRCPVANHNQGTKYFNGQHSSKMGRQSQSQRESNLETSDNYQRVASTSSEPSSTMLCESIERIENCQRKTNNDKQDKLSFQRYKNSVPIKTTSENINGNSCIEHKSYQKEHKINCDKSEKNIKKYDGHDEHRKTKSFIVSRDNLSEILGHQKIFQTGMQENSLKTLQGNHNKKSNNNEHQTYQTERKANQKQSQRSQRVKLVCTIPREIFDEENISQVDDGKQHTPQNGKRLSSRTQGRTPSKINSLQDKRDRTQSRIDADRECSENSITFETQKLKGNSIAGDNEEEPRRRRLLCSRDVGRPELKQNSLADDFKIISQTRTHSSGTQGTHDKRSSLKCDHQQQGFKFSKTLGSPEQRRESWTDDNLQNISQSRILTSRTQGTSDIENSYCNADVKYDGSRSRTKKLKLKCDLMADVDQECVHHHGKLLSPRMTGTTGLIQNSIADDNLQSISHTRTYNLENGGKLESQRSSLKGDCQQQESEWSRMQEMPKLKMKSLTDRSGSRSHASTRTLGTQKTRSHAVASNGEERVHQSGRLLSSGTPEVKQSSLIGNDLKGTSHNTTQNSVIPEGKNSVLNDDYEKQGSKCIRPVSSRALGESELGRKIARCISTENKYFLRKISQCINQNSKIQDTPEVKNNSLNGNYQFDRSSKNSYRSQTSSRTQKLERNSMTDDNQEESSLCGRLVISRMLGTPEVKQKSIANDDLKEIFQDRHLISGTSERSQVRSLLNEDNQKKESQSRRPVKSSGTVEMPVLRRNSLTDEDQQKISQSKTQNSITKGILQVKGNSLNDDYKYDRSQYRSHASSSGVEKQKLKSDLMADYNQEEIPQSGSSSRKLERPEFNSRRLVKSEAIRNSKADDEHQKITQSEKFDRSRTLGSPLANIDPLISVDQQHRPQCRRHVKSRTLGNPGQQNNSITNDSHETRSNCERRLRSAERKTNSLPDDNRQIKVFCQKQDSSEMLGQPGIEMTEHDLQNLARNIEKSMRSIKGGMVSDSDSISDDELGANKNVKVGNLHGILQSKNMQRERDKKISRILYDNRNESSSTEKCGSSHTYREKLEIEANNLQDACNQSIKQLSNFFNRYMPEENGSCSKFELRYSRPPNIKYE